MRILHVGKYYPPFHGGIENFLADLVGAQVAAGHQVAVVAHHHQRGRSEWAADGNPLIDRVPCHGQLLYAPLAPAYPLWLERRLRRFKPELIHLHLPNTSAFWLLMSPAARRLPWLVHWHADVVASTIDRRLSWAYPLLYRPFEQWLLSRSSRIIATSPDYLAASAPLIRWRSRCVTVPLGIDPGRLATSDPRSLQWANQQWGGEGLRILCIGRMTYYKGQSVLIDAVARTEGVRVVMVGGGDLEPTISRRSSDPLLKGRITLPGHCSEPQLAALLASCDLLALPSLERTEAFGVVLLEAMAAGKPVVASDIPGSGVGWVVREGGCGWLVTPGSVGQWIATLTTIRDQPTSRQLFGGTGTDRFSRLFTIKQVEQQIEYHYRRMTAVSTTNYGDAAD